MAPVKISYVVSFSSQDPKYPVENLLLEDGLRPWLGCPQDRSRQLRVELQLERASPISYVDVGNCGCAFLQIEVGRSSWPLDRPYLTLLPSVALMTPADSKLDQNRCGVRMFKEADFPALAVGQKWDRLRLTCSQPFSKRSQFGLSFIRVRTPQEPEHPPPPSQQGLVGASRRLRVLLTGGTRREVAATALFPPLPLLVPHGESPGPEPPRGVASEPAGTWTPPGAHLPGGPPISASRSSREEERLKSRLQQLEPGSWSPERLSRPARMVLSAARSRALRPRAGTGAPRGDPELPTEDPGGSGVPGSAQDIPAAPMRGRRQPASGQRASSPAGRVPGCHGDLRGGREPKPSSAHPDAGEPRTTASPPLSAGRFRLDLLPAHASSCGEEDPDDAAWPSSPLAEASPNAWVSCPICELLFSAAEVERHASACGEQAATPGAPSPSHRLG
ncbi:protein XNDC1N [Pelecanus crispus]|uniref:protein XNDC1N n=1 Tax=Pelecanus crispus TaxID=36300 RepID=UPI003F5D37AD